MPKGVGSEAHHQAVKEAQCLGGSDKKPAIFMVQGELH